MSSKSMYRGQPGWKPAGFRSMGSAARATVREDKKDWEDRARRARRKALGLPEKVEEGAPSESVKETIDMIDLTKGSPPNVDQVLAQKMQMDTMIVHPREIDDIKTSMEPPPVEHIIPSGRMWTGPGIANAPKEARHDERQDLD